MFGLLSRVAETCRNMPQLESCFAEGRDWNAGNVLKKIDFQPKPQGSSAQEHGQQLFGFHPFHPFSTMVFKKFTGMRNAVN